MAFAVLFQLVTLPVEFDASRRAMNQIEELNIVNSKEIPLPLKKVLNVAAMTYVAATAVAVAELLRFIMIARNQSYNFELKTAVLSWMDDAAVFLWGYGLVF